MDLIHTAVFTRALLPLGCLDVSQTSCMWARANSCVLHAWKAKSTVLRYWDDHIHLLCEPFIHITFELLQTCWCCLFLCPTVMRGSSNFQPSKRQLPTEPRPAESLSDRWMLLDVDSRGGSGGGGNRGQCHRNSRSGPHCGPPDRETASVIQCLSKLVPNQKCWNCKHCFVWMRDLSIFSGLYVPLNKKAGPNLAPLLKLI